MKREQILLILGFVAAAAFIASRKGQAASNAGGEIFPDGDTNGWRYFTNGTAISPDGTYYLNGKMVWNPMS